MKRRRDVSPDAGADVDAEEPPAAEVASESASDSTSDSTFKPLDMRRIRQIRRWFEGNRADAPTVEELREFVAWVSQEIEFALARHQPTRDLIGYLNAARAE